MRRKYCEEKTDKKCSPHLQQNISLPFSFPLPVKYCQIIQAGVSKLILSPELGGAAPVEESTQELIMLNVNTIWRGVLFLEKKVFTKSEINE